MKRTIMSGVLLSLLSSGCAGGRAILADDGDLADYRAFRAADREGVRLSRAEAYLAAHPRGAWAAEVKRQHEQEEEEFFDAAKTSRDGVRSYLGYLPRGPHAAAAQSLLEAYDAHLEDEETARMMREARRTEATLAAADLQRRAVGEAVLAAVAALLDPAAYGARLDEAPPSLAVALGGGRATLSTWGGGALPQARDRDLYYLIPTSLERESRVVTLHVEVELDDDARVRGGRVSGEGLFVAWTEADTHRPLDPSSPAARAAAAEHVVDLLSGAFEATAPSATCRARGTGAELFVRRCNGWEIFAVMGDVPGGDGPSGRDSIVIRRPTP